MRTTPNFGLKITEGNDDWRDIFDDNADNMDTLDNLNGDIIPIGEDSGTMIREYIDGGMVEVVPEYDDGETYAVGDIVCNDGLNYRCKTAISTPESFTPAKWEMITLAEVVAENSKEIPKLQNGLAVIVDGDTCATAVPAGGYAYIRNNTHGLANGLYKNTSSSAFPVSGGTANSTVFTAVSGGLGGEVAALNNNLPIAVSGSITFAANSPNGYVTINVPNASSRKWVANQNSSSSGNSYSAIFIDYIIVESNKITIAANRQLRSNLSSALTINVSAIGL